MSYTKKDLEVTRELSVCSTKIETLKKKFDELSKQIRELEREMKEDRRIISDKRLKIYLAIASILGSIGGGLFIEIFRRLYP